MVFENVMSKFRNIRDEFLNNNCILFESLNEGFQEIKNSLGTAQDLPALNQPKSKSICNAYTEEATQRTVELFYSI